MSELGSVSERIAKSIARRDDAGLGVEGKTTAYRLVHDVYDGLPDVIVDRLNSVAVLRLRSEARWSNEDEVLLLAECLVRDAKVRHVWVVVDEPSKHADREHTGVEAALNARLATSGLSPVTQADVVAHENGLAYWLSHSAGFSNGLFFDMREVRRDLATRWRGREVVNLFAYTCGFGVALAEANKVINVDVSKPYLDWGERNYQLNGLDTAGGFVAKDAFAYLDFADKKGIRYDALIVDPPAFSRGKRGKSRRFTMRTDLEPLVDQALRCLKPGGELFVSTNYASLSQRRFQRLVRECAKRVNRRVQRQWWPAADYPVPEAEYHLKTALIA